MHATASLAFVYQRERLIRRLSLSATMHQVRSETSVLSVELRGRLIMNDLRLNISFAMRKFYQKFYFVPLRPKACTGVQIV